MSDREEFFLLCEAILDDGEVIAAEAYRLAQWLNAHPSIAASSPANELVTPLREIWADGTVNRRELQSLARLLVSLTREGRTGQLLRETAAAQIKLPAFDVSINSGARLP